MTALILWIYIGLLMVGGLIGFFVGRSRISLIMAAGFSVLLGLCASGVITAFYIANVLIGLLLVVFAMRLAKTKKMMPSGVMLLVTFVTFVLLLVVR